MARILVVDDVKFIARMIAGIFEADGHEVLVVTSGAEAIEAARTHQPDLVLLDLKMPGMDGLEVARTLRKESGTHQIPIMMVSSKGDLSSIADAFAADVSEYVTKPFQTAELIEKAELLLGGFRMDYSIGEVEDVPTVTVLHDEIAAGTLEEIPQALSMARGPDKKPMILDLSRVRNLQPGVEEALDDFQRRIGELGAGLEIVRPKSGVGASSIFPGLSAEARGLHQSRQDAVAAARERGVRDGTLSEEVSNPASGRNEDPAPEESADVTQQVEDTMNANVRLAFETFDNMAVVRVLRSALTEEAITVIGRDYPRSAHVLLVDISGVQSMSMAETRALGELAQEIGLSGRTLKLANPSTKLEETLQNAGFGAHIFWMQERPRRNSPK